MSVDFNGRSILFARHESDVALWMIQISNTPVHVGNETDCTFVFWLSRGFARGGGMGGRLK
jgi:hypothetical protein